MNGPLLDDLFGLEAHALGDSKIADELPLAYRDKYAFSDVRLGGEPPVDFILARAKIRPTVTGAAKLREAVAKVSENPVVIGLDGVDLKTRNALVRAGMPFISGDGNAYLPFVGLMAVPPKPARDPSRLSPQAQRIFLGLLSGSWEGLSAGELARECDRSNASVTKYLSELEAVMPTILLTEGKRRTLRNPGVGKDELLERFEPYLTSPVTKVHRLDWCPELGVLAGHGALLSGETALSFYSDLALDLSRVTVMMDAEKMEALRTELGQRWRVSEWRDEAPLAIEEWTYPCDRASYKSEASTGMGCVDPCSLYLEMSKGDAQGDIRLEDAIEQLREAVCL